MTGPNTKSVIFFRKERPEFTCAEIARRVGLTRERVRQILFEAGLSTTREGYGESIICPDCGGPKNSAPKRCRDCNHKAHLVELICANCLTEFEMTMANYRTRLKRGCENFYHNRQCWETRGHN